MTVCPKLRGAGLAFDQKATLGLGGRASGDDCTDPCFPRAGLIAERGGALLFHGSRRERQYEGQRSMRSLGQIVACLVILLGVSSTAHAAAYRFTTIDVPGASSTTAWGINGARQIVGTFHNSTGTHGFSYSGGSFTTIDGPGALGFTEAAGINDAGQVVGSFTDKTGTFGFLSSAGRLATIDGSTAKNAGGGACNLAPTGESAGQPLTGACGINDAGQVVGDFSESTGLHGFLYSGGRITILDVPGSGVPGFTSTMALGINDAGQVVGTFADSKNRRHGFLHSGASFTTINAPPATGNTWAYGINGTGQIVASTTARTPASSTAAAASRPSPCPVPLPPPPSASTIPGRPSEALRTARASTAFWRRR